MAKLVQSDIVAASVRLLGVDDAGSAQLRTNADAFYPEAVEYVLSNWHWEELDRRVALKGVVVADLDHEMADNNQNVTIEVTNPIKEITNENVIDKPIKDYAYTYALPIYSKGLPRANTLSQGVLVPRRLESDMLFDTSFELFAVGGVDVNAFTLSTDDDDPVLYFTPSRIELENDFTTVPAGILKVIQLYLALQIVSEATSNEAQQLTLQQQFDNHLGTALAGQRNRNPQRAVRIPPSLNRMGYFHRVHSRTTVRRPVRRDKINGN